MDSKTAVGDESASDATGAVASAANSTSKQQVGPAAVSAAQPRIAKQNKAPTEAELKEAMDTQIESDEAKNEQELENED